VSRAPLLYTKITEKKYDVFEKKSEAAVLALRGSFSENDARMRAE